MYKLKNTAVDLEAEIKALADHVEARWDNVPDFGALARAIHDQVCMAAPFWFDEYPVFAHLQERSTKRESLLRELGESSDGEERLSFYDQSCTLMREMSFVASRLSTIAKNLDGRWDFEDRTRDAYRQLCAQFPGLPKARPKGWSKIRRDQYGMTRYAEKLQREEEAAFNGADSSGEGGGSFVFRTSVPQVAYDHFEQDLEAPYTLVSSIFAHFLVIRRHENTLAILEELRTLPLRDTEPQAIFDLRGETRHPLVAAMFKLITVRFHPESDYHEAIEEARAFASRPAVEQNAVKAKGLKAIAGLLSSVRKGNSGPCTPKVDPVESACREFLTSLPR